MEADKIPVIHIPWDAEGIFVSRENRFLGIVDIINTETIRNEKVHIRDPGRLEDILYSGNRVLLNKAEGEKRKTKWEMIAGSVNNKWILINSVYHRKIAEQVIENENISPLGKVDSIIPEQQFGDSRLDFLVNRKDSTTWIEVKGCTLQNNGIALFPDAPTTRGQRHIKELIKAVEQGHTGAMIVLVFRPDAVCFTANMEIDSEFSRLYKQALEIGVQVYPLLFSYENGTLYYISRLPLCNYQLKDEHASS
ncbi:MAG: DNA/RNA nuclease SfsA [Methanohalobium sp.]|uniref:DNA/RNA nuclease SfsA n=1 Tax=Methanohalobium sp. TaxID=2837493 RepID=UPI0039799140